MGIATLLLLSTGLLNQKPAPVFAEVSIGSRGPYRFLVDTGAQTSLIDPALAAELHLQPQFRVEVVTQHSTRLLPALRTKALRVSDKHLPELELVLHDVSAARHFDSSVRGVLGINALAGLNFTLSPSTGRLSVEAERPAGEAVPYYPAEGRMALKARMGTETLTLILDSGTTNVILFRTPIAMKKVPPVATTFQTLDGARSVVPTCWTADMFFTDRLRVGMKPAAIVSRKNTEVEGLIPASFFKQIYVDQRRGEFVLVP